MNELLKSIHKLACMRYFEAPPETVGVVIKPYAREGGPVVPPHGPREMADACIWTAQVYMGRGKWGNIAGEGNTPEEALTSLHGGMVDAHRAVDERRGVVLDKALGLGGCECNADDARARSGLPAEHLASCPKVTKP